MITRKALNGKPYAGNPHMPCEGEEGTSATMTRRGPRLIADRLKLLVTIALLSFSMPLTAWEWDYDEKRNGTVEIIGIYIDEDVETMPSILNIPATLEGMPVTSIRDSAFSECSELKTVTIPSSVVSIGDGAFIDCGKLTSVTIRDGAVSSGSMVRIGHSAFGNCYELTSMKFGNKVAKIEDGAFLNCRKLSSVELPDSVTSIGEYAFLNCGLKSITFGNGVTIIGKNALANCTNLTTVTIPGNVKQIGDSAFSACARLEKVSMGDGVTELGKWAFSSCIGLISVMMPDSVTSIGESAFHACVKLEKVVLPRSLTDVSDYVFRGCIGLEDIVFQENVSKIGVGAFMGSGVTNVDLQATKVTEIGKEAFKSCPNLTKVTLPKTLKSLADEAFFGLGIYDPAFIVFRGEPPLCGEKVFEEYHFGRYYHTSLEQRRLEHSFSHTVFGAYMPVDNQENYDAWRNVIDAWGRWNEVQMVMDVRPIGCDYATANCGELNISWCAFPAYTNDSQKEFWSFNNSLDIERDLSCLGTSGGDWEKMDWIEYGGGVLVEQIRKQIRELGLDYDALYSRGNWSIFADMKFSIWRSSEDPNEPYDDFSCASNIAQHVGGEFSAASGFSATNFIDKSFGKFKGTKPVKYWIEIEDPDDPDNLRYLPNGGLCPTTRIRPIIEPDSCVTRRRFAILCGYNCYDNSGKDTSIGHRHTIKEIEFLSRKFEEDDGFKNAIKCVDQMGTVQAISRAWTKMADDTKPGDVLFFYISTHGAAEANGGSWVVDGDRKLPVLQVYNSFSDGKKAVYSSDQMALDLAKFPSTNGVKVINVINACFSAAMYADVHEGCSKRTDYDPKNKAWICAAQHDQLADCVVAVSQFATTFLEWGWGLACADMPTLINVNGYYNDTANDGILTLWELANYSQALVCGNSNVYNEDTRRGASKANYPFLQRVFIDEKSERILKHTTIATGVKHASGDVPPVISISALSGKDFLYGYDDNKHEFIMMANKFDPSYFYDVKYSCESANAWVRVLPAAFSNEGVALRIRECGFEHGVDKNGNKVWLNIYGGAGESVTTGLGHEYVPLFLNTEYQIAIRGVNEFGFGEWSNLGAFRTRKGFLDMIMDGEYEKDQSIKGNIERMLNSDEMIQNILIVIDNIKVENVETGKGDVGKAFMSQAKSNMGASMFVAVQIKYAAGPVDVYSGIVSFDKTNNAFVGMVVCDNDEMSISIDKSNVVTGISPRLSFSGTLVLNNNDSTDEDFWFVTLNPVGGEVSPVIRTVASGTVVGVLPIPTRSGYTFVGWFTAENGGAQVSASTQVRTNVTFYAHWTANGDDPGTGGGATGDGESDGGDVVGDWIAGRFNMRFAKAQTVLGALYGKDGKPVGTVQMKVGKVNKKKRTVKIAATATLLADGKAKKVAAKAVTVKVGTAAAGTAAPHVTATITFKSPIGKMAFEMEADGTFKLKNNSYVMAEKKVGGSWTRAGAGVYVDVGGGRGATALPAGTIEELLPNGEPVIPKAGKWSFAKAAGVKYAKDKKTKVASLVVDTKKGKNLSGMKLTYVPKTGIFKGSFKIYAIQGGKLKKFKAKVVGVVVDGKGWGSAAGPKGARWGVTVE